MLVAGVSRSADGITKYAKLKRDTMEALLEKLDMRLREWRPEMANEVRKALAEIVDLADKGALDLMGSRTAEQEVLDLINDPASQ